MKQKVVVAMSGGVDSSVAAALLKDKGYEVIGITLNLFGNTDGNIPCCGAGIQSDKARKVCNLLGIRHYQKNSRELFYKNVIENFVKEYFLGRTPNPCVECNRLIKFSYLFSIARQIGADFISTGHYARIAVKDGKRFLMRGRDSAKDQSYFLYCLKYSELKDIIFPLGDLTKTEVRDIAGELNLPTAREKESKDVCFIPDGNCFNFLKSFALVGHGDGKIKDMEGRVIGSHKGFFGFTIGQRRNLGVSRGKRCYVVSVNPGANEVIVGNRKDANVRSFKIKDMNYLTENRPQTGQRFQVQIRYKHQPVMGEIVQQENCSVQIRFDEPQFAVTCGQSAVL
ncbi:MAG: tRNA 2-thiouridine(34) synthase MnmA, partial [Candidatus Edwardsbacteria bacterium]